MGRKQIRSDAAGTNVVDSRDRATEEIKQHRALKRLQIALTSVVAAVVLASAVVVIFQNLSSSSGVSAGTVNCPLQITVRGKPYLNDRGQVVPWRIFVRGGDGNAPNILASSDAEVHPAGSSGPSCAFNIVKLPGKKLSGVEWRIGRALSDPSIARGKTAHISFMLKASRPITFDDAVIFADDGRKIQSTPIPYLYQNWKKFALDYKVSSAATIMEIWLRLDLGGQISSTGTVYMSDVRVDLE